MKTWESNPPALACWLLRHARPGNHGDALEGDLIERYREGRSDGWFWQQVCIAIAAGLLTESRRRWPEFAYAFAGVLVPILVPMGRIVRAGRAIPWWLLPSPLSSLALDLSPFLVIALCAMFVLAAALLAAGRFGWANLVRTAVISVTAIAAQSVLLGLFYNHLRRTGTEPPSAVWFALLLLPVEFALLLASAWLGCRDVRRNPARA